MAFPETRVKTLHLQSELWLLCKNEHSENKKKLLEMKNLEQKCKLSTQGIEVKEIFEKAEQEGRDRK